MAISAQILPATGKTPGTTGTYDAQLSISAQIPHFPADPQGDTIGLHVREELRANISLRVAGAMPTGYSRVAERTFSESNDLPLCKLSVEVQRHPILRRRPAQRLGMLLCGLYHSVKRAFDSEAIEHHRASVGGRLIAEFKEIESGKRSDRPQFAAALAACRAHKATLCIARLDRLSRNVHFLSGLMESGVDSVACDMSQANRLTLHVLSAVAEHEREMISARTKAALKAAKERGVRLGNPRLKPGTPQAAAKARARKSDRARDLAPMIQEARQAGAISLRGLDAALSENCIPTPAGCDAWSPTQVARIVHLIDSCRKAGAPLGFASAAEIVRISRGCPFTADALWPTIGVIPIVHSGQKSFARSC